MLSQQWRRVNQVTTRYRLPGAPGRVGHYVTKTPCLRHRAEDFRSQTGFAVMAYNFRVFSDPAAR